jgi:hypothetical protein
MKPPQMVSFSFACISVCSFIFVCLLLLPEHSFSSSQFSRQEVADPPGDWVDMAVIENQQLDSGSLFQPTDIYAVNFFSDGKLLNATIWINDKFEEKPPAEFGNVSYGAYFDVDFNEKTGTRGIDYRVETVRENGSELWSRVFEEWSASGKQRLIERIDNYTGFYKEGESFVTIYADLEAMGSPDSFRVVFFAETYNGLFKWYADYTNWIILPPPEFVLSTVPESVVLDQGGDENIAIQIKSTAGSEPTIYLSPMPSNATESMTLSDDVVQMPSLGMATTRLDIKSKPNAEAGTHLIFLKANATFPLQPIVEGVANPTASTGSIRPEEEALQKQGNQDMEQLLSFIIKINKPITWLEQIRMIWDQWGNLISFILGTSVFAVIKERFWKIMKPKVMKIRKANKQRP